jgi:hypothetical protein
MASCVLRWGSRLWEALTSGGAEPLQPLRKLTQYRLGVKLD